MSLRSPSTIKVRLLSSFARQAPPPVGCLKLWSNLFVNKIEQVCKAPFPLTCPRSITETARKKARTRKPKVFSTDLVLGPRNTEGLLKVWDFEELLRLTIGPSSSSLRKPEGFWRTLKEGGEKSETKVAKAPLVYVAAKWWNLLSQHSGASPSLVINLRERSGKK